MSSYFSSLLIVIKQTNIAPVIKPHINPIKNPNIIYSSGISYTISASVPKNFDISICISSNTSNALS